jgi:hypothetical protein
MTHRRLTDDTEQDILDAVHQDERASYIAAARVQLDDPREWLTLA